MMMVMMMVMMVMAMSTLLLAAIYYLPREGVKVEEGWGCNKSKQQKRKKNVWLFPFKSLL